MAQQTENAAIDRLGVLVGEWCMAAQFKDLPPAVGERAGNRSTRPRGVGEEMTDFSDMARGIIESNRYMLLGTADEEGVPWVTPVWFAQSDYRRFVWVSSPDRRHSRNVRARPEVSIVIFDSQIPVGSALAVYMSARAEELAGAELERDLAFFDTAGQAEGLTLRWALEDVLAPAPYRLYRATVSQQWVLDPDSRPDDRADVTP